MKVSRPLQVIFLLSLINIVWQVHQQNKEEWKTLHERLIPEVKVPKMPKCKPGVKQRVIITDKKDKVVCTIWHDPSRAKRNGF